MTWLIVAVVLVVIMIALSLAAGAAWEAEIRHFGRFLRTMFQRGRHKGPMLPSETAPRTALVGRPPAHARTVPRKDAAGRPPWPTAGQPVLDEQAQVQRELAAFVRSQLPEHEEDATREDMELALALLRERTAVNLPLEPVWEPTNEQTAEMYFGTAPQLEVEPELAKQVTA